MLIHRSGISDPDFLADPLLGAGEGLTSHHTNLANACHESTLHPVVADLNHELDVVRSHIFPAEQHVPAVKIKMAVSEPSGNVLAMESGNAKKVLGLIGKVYPHRGTTEGRV